MYGCTSFGPADERVPAEGRSRLAQGHSRRDGGPEDHDHDGETSSPDIGAGADATLGGYFSVHSRPPAFEGVDGQPYTVSIETERSPDLRVPVAGYLVFPRWAETGLGIVGHVESPLLWRGATKEEVVEEAGRTTLHDVQRILNEAIVSARAEEESP